MEGISRFGPRTVRPTRLLGTIRLAFGAVLTIVVALFLHFGTRDLNELTLLRSSGKVVAGRVDDLQIRHRKGSHYYLQYSYEAGGTSFHDRTTVPEDMYNSLRLGDPVDVTLDPANPELHRFGTVTESSIEDARLRWLTFASLVIITAAVIFVCIEVRARREAAALTSFEAVPAQVLEIGPRTSRGGNATVTVCYKTDEAEQTLSLSFNPSYTRFSAFDETTLFLDPLRPAKSVLLPTIYFFQAA